MPPPLTTRCARWLALGKVHGKLVFAEPAKVTVRQEREIQFFHPDCEPLSVQNRSNDQGPLCATRRGCGLRLHPQEVPANVVRGTSEAPFRFIDLLINSSSFAKMCLRNISSSTATSQRHQNSSADVELVHFLNWVPVEAGIYRVNKVRDADSVEVARSLR